jgi:hypothetical protein
MRISYKQHREKVFDSVALSVNFKDIRRVTAFAMALF